jgi:LmbE family N-acetylglucosaminyl deacetylase
VVYHYIQSYFISPDFIVDVSEHWQTKMTAIKAFKTQFFNDGTAPETYISKPGFIKMVEARGIEFGHAIGAEYGEGFTIKRFLGVNSLFDLK